MTLFERIPLRGRFLIGPGVGLVLMLLLGAIFFSSIEKQKRLLDVLEREELAVVDAIAQLTSRLALDHARFYQLLNDPDVRHDEERIYEVSKPILEELYEAGVVLRRLREEEGGDAAASPEASEALLRLHEYREGAILVLETASVDLPLAEERMAVVNGHFNQLNQALLAWLTVVEGKASDHIGAGIDQATAHLHRFGLVFVLAAAAMILLGSSLAEVLSRRLRSLIAAMDRLASGDGQAAGSGDELAALERAVGVFERTLEGLEEANATLEEQVAERTREVRASEAQLRQAQKMEAVGQLAGGVAHDFNNLLTVILSYAELIGDHQLSAGDRDAVVAIREAAQRAATLTQRLLAFSRQQVVKPQVLRLDAVILDLEKMLRRILPEDIRLETAAGDEPLYVHADPGQIEQVLVNLVVNARDAMPGGGRLLIRLEPAELPASGVDLPPGPYVCLQVEDSGVGMDEAVRQRVFEPFFTTKETGKGTGLGLSVVYGIVQQHQGAVTVASRPRQGSTFAVYLPRVPASAAAPEPAAAEPVAGGSETILLVEDEEGVRSLAVRILEACGYRVLTARDGQEGLEVAATFAGPLHLLVSDLVMPRLGGLEMAKTLWNERPDLPALFITGYAQNGATIPERQRKAAFWLFKPFTPDALARRVREILDRTGSP